MCSVLLAGVRLGREGTTSTGLHDNLSRACIATSSPALDSCDLD